MTIHVTYLTLRGVGTTYINRTERALETVICFSLPWIIYEQLKIFLEMWILGLHTLSAISSLRK